MKWDGRVDPEQRDSVTVTVSSATSGTVAVLFPRAFINSPLIRVQAIGTSIYNAYVLSPTTTGMTVGVRHIDNTSGSASVTVHWFAKEP